MQKKISYTAIGDVGIDIYPKLGKRFPGGMALNSGYHAAKAGAHASVISVVGTDKDGSYLKQFLNMHSIFLGTLQTKEGDTDTVEVVLDEKGVPEYQNWKPGVLDRFELCDSHSQFLQQEDTAIAVNLPELRHLFDAFAQMNLPNTLKVGDFTDLSENNGDQHILHEYKDNFDIFALSIDERINERLESFSSFVISQNKMGIALLGERGSVVISEGKKFIQQATKVDVVDTTGAGDSYLSTFLVEYLREKNIQHAMKRATHKASQVIQYYGAVQK